MNTVTSSRRQFLRGLGTAIALPLLESALPGGLRLARASTEPAAAPRRMAFVYVPNGKNMVDWTPATTGADYELPSILQPLAEHRRDFAVLTGLAHNQANSLGDGGGDHARAAATFLTGHHPRKTSGASIESSISLIRLRRMHWQTIPVCRRWN